MKKTINKGSEEWSTFTDVWALYQEIGGVEEGDGYWEETMHKVDEYMKKHDSVLGMELAMAILGTLLDESKEQRCSRMIAFLSYEALENKQVAHDMAEAALKVSEHWMKGEK